MKKLFLLAATAMMALTVNAQVGDDYEEGQQKGFVDSRKNVVSIGVTAGGNFSMMSKYDPIDLGKRTGIGFQGGLAANVHFGQRQGAEAGTGPIGLQLEVLYAQHNMKTDLNDDIKLGYLEVPVLFKYYITKELSIELGPTFAFLMSKKPDVLVGPSTTIAIGDLKGGDIRATGGISYQTKGFFVNARYSYGFGELAGNFPCKVSAATLSVGYLFDVFKF
ncbi:MAG: PorT family protein [Prevotella sp.]|nr:PorT family protein [Prevotella sp.]